MTTPSKSWGRADNASTPSGKAVQDARELLSPQNTGGSSAGGNTSRPQLLRPQPPALPPRPQLSGVGFGAHYGNGFMGTPLFGQYGGLGYNGLTPYGAYGAYGAGTYGSYNFACGGPYGLGGYTAGGGGSSEVARVAEESARSAFQSVEALVRAFGSISMMLESTYFALYSSFRAIIGVADHFSRMRDQLAELLSTLSMVRTLRWIIWKTLHVLGFVQVDPERAWERAAVSSADSSQRHRSGSANLGTSLSQPLSAQPSWWPIVSFLALVVAGPWLIYRMFAPSLPSVDTSWASGDTLHFVAVAQFDFVAENERELSLRAGSYVRLAPKHLQPRVRGWLLGSVDGKRTGLVPANYLRIIGPADVAFEREDVSTKEASSSRSANSISTAVEVPSQSQTQAESSNTDDEQALNISSEFVQINMNDLEKTSSTSSPRDCSGSDAEEGKKEEI